MPKPASQFLEDIGHVLAALMGNVMAARGPARDEAGKKLGLLLKRLKLVGRDEFDALHDMLKHARAEQEKLRARVASLETVHRVPPATVKPAVKGRLKTAKKSATGARARRNSRHRRTR